MLCFSIVVCLFCILYFICIFLLLLLTWRIKPDDDDDDYVHSQSITIFTKCVDGIFVWWWWWWWLIVLTGLPIRKNCLTFGGDQFQIRDHFSTSLTAAELRILVDLFLIRSPADFHDTQRNDWQHSQHFATASDPADIRIRIESRITFGWRRFALSEHSTNSSYHCYSTRKRSQTSSWKFQHTRQWLTASCR